MRNTLTMKLISLILITHLLFIMLGEVMLFFLYELEADLRKYLKTYIFLHEMDEVRISISSHY